VAAAAAKLEPRAELKLKLTEIFFSIQGEALDSGCPSVFVRLTGCPLRCGYCDTAYAFSGGRLWTLGQVLDEVDRYRVSHVCVTGGEPLAQPNCLHLLTRLCDRGHVVSLETSGALDIGRVDSRVKRIVDVKTPGSGEVARNRPENWALLTARDALKFVLVDRHDYEWACAWLAEQAELPCPVYYSPSYGVLDPRELAEWILADQLPVRLQLQLHKLLWGDSPGR
jgi:7-carboxy-7-deazaguanine synthase